MVPQRPACQKAAAALLLPLLVALASLLTPSLVPPLLTAPAPGVAQAVDAAAGLPGRDVDQPPPDRTTELRDDLARLGPAGPPGDLAEAHNALGLQHWADSRFDSALVHLRRAHGLWWELADTSGLARVFNNIGVTYYQWGHYEPALDAFQRSLSLRRRLGDMRGTALVLSNIGNTYRDLQLYEHALPVLKSAVATADSLGQSAVRGYALHNMGLLQLDMGSHAEARATLLASMAQYARLDRSGMTRRDASSGWALNAVHLGLLDVLEGQPRRGAVLLQEVRDSARAVNHPRREATALLHLGRAWRATAELGRAVEALEGALAIARATGQRTIALDALAELADTHEARGETELALLRLRAHQTLRDSVFSQHTLQRLAAAEARAEADAQEAENALLLQQQAVREALILRQRVAGALGGALLIMALVLLGVLLRFNRSGRERQRLLGSANAALAETNRELRVALSEVRTLKGLIPICACCKKVRDDQGFWEAVETYISHRSDALFSHSICADCGPALYGDDWPAQPEPARSAHPRTIP